MTGNSANARLAVATMSILAIVSVRAQASQCSQASATGYWAYTYTGTVYVPDAAPIAVHQPESTRLSGQSGENSTASSGIYWKRVNTTGCRPSVEDFV